MTEDNRFALSAFYCSTGALLPGLPILAALVMRHEPHLETE